MIEYDLEQRFDTATEAVDEGAKEFLQQIGGDISVLTQASLEDLIIDLSPGIETNFTDEGGEVYSLDELAAGTLVGAGQHLPEAC